MKTTRSSSRAAPCLNHTAYGAGTVLFRRRNGRTPTSWRWCWLDASAPSSIRATVPRPTRTIQLIQLSAVTISTGRPSGFILRQTALTETLQPRTRKRRTKQRPIRCCRRDTERLRRLGDSTPANSTASGPLLGTGAIISTASTAAVSSEHYHAWRRQL